MISYDDDWNQSKEWKEDWDPVHTFLEKWKSKSQTEIRCISIKGHRGCLPLASPLHSATPGAAGTHPIFFPLFLLSLPKYEDEEEDSVMTHPTWWRVNDHHAIQPNRLIWLCMYACPSESLATVRGLRHHQHRLPLTAGHCVRDLWRSGQAALIQAR